MYRRSDRIARLNEMVEKGLLTRREFRGRRGHKPAVVYADETIPEVPGTPVESIIAALCPEMMDHRDFDNFAPDLFPPWFAHLTMWMEDHGRKESWKDMTYAYAGMMARSDLLSASDWDRVRLMLLRLPLMELALISRMEILETALVALDKAVDRNHYPDALRLDLRAQIQHERSRRGHPETAILDRAAGVFAPHSDLHIKSIFNDACKLLPPKRSRRPGVVTKLSGKILHLISREIDIQEQAYAQPAFEKPVKQKALPSPKAKPLTVQKKKPARKRKPRPSTR